MRGRVHVFFVCIVLGVFEEEERERKSKTKTKLMSKISVIVALSQYKNKRRTFTPLRTQLIWHSLHYFCIVALSIQLFYSH